MISVIAVLTRGAEAKCELILLAMNDVVSLTSELHVDVEAVLRRRS